jgi:hypothetical protein
MIHVDKDSEGLEYVQLDDYYINDDDYISDTPGLDPDAAGAFAHHDLPVHALDTMETAKIKDEDDVQKNGISLGTLTLTRARSAYQNSTNISLATSMTAPQATFAYHQCRSGRPQHHHCHAAGA